MNIRRIITVLFLIIGIVLIALGIKDFFRYYDLKSEVNEPGLGGLAIMGAAITQTILGLTSFFIAYMIKK